MPKERALSKEGVRTNNRAVPWQQSYAYNDPLLFVIPSVGWAFGPPKGMKIGHCGTNMKPVWDGKGSLRSGLSEAVSECGLDRAY